MIKNFLIAVLCLTSYSVFAQNGTISPYSFFGIGDSREKGTVENQMMGGLRMYADSIHINLRNPAAYSDLRLTTYSLGLAHNEFRLKDANQTQNTSVTNIEYIAVGLPLAKNFGMGFGLQPFSSVGYDLVQEVPNASNDTITNVFTGQGGLNKVFVSAGYKPAKNLSIGASINYNFGTLDYQRIQTVQNVQFGTLDSRTSRMNGFDFNYTLNYTPKITKKLTLFTHFGANTQVNLSAENEEEIGSFSTSTGQNIELVEVDLAARGLKRTDVRIPTIFTGGLGLGEDKKWFIGAEYSTQQMSDFQNEFLRIGNVVYQDASTFALGGYYVPDYTAFSGFFKRVTYRAGMRYDQTGMLINGQEINNFGITFGLGIPLRGIGVDRFSNINLGFEFGKRGTTDAGLVQENYFKVNIGLSLNARWFQKRQID